MDFKECNELGLIPGPHETEEEFFKRVSFCLNLPHELAKHADIPFDVQQPANKSILTEAFPSTKVLYGISPHWVPLFLNNYQLAPWHGGCAWIFQLSDDSPLAAFLQLRSQFKNQSTYWGLYHRNELIAHELSHIGRMAFEEPQFEEILAYRSSHSRWRRWLGPIVQSAKESLLFILLLAAVIMAHFALMTTEQPFIHRLTYWFDFVLLGLIGMALARLALRQWQFEKALVHLKHIYPQDNVAEHILYRLTDHEIRLFATSTSIRHYIEKQTSFRWQFIKTQIAIYEGRQI